VNKRKKKRKREREREREREKWIKKKIEQNEKGK